MRQISLLFLMFVLSGCATQASHRVHVGPQSLGNIEYHTSILADELFANFRHSENRGQYRFAVAGFVPVVHMQYLPGSQHPLMLLGHQLEQGLMTEALRRGMIAQDYKIANDIIIDAHSDRVLSREIEQLSKQRLDVDFFVSGTITEQQNGAVVNARVVHVKTKDVIAAATKFFPSELFWEQEKVTTRAGKLYRTGSE